MSESMEQYAIIKNCVEVGITPLETFQFLIFLLENVPSYCAENTIMTFGFVSFEDFNLAPYQIVSIKI
jgi:hypothetical protein